MGAPFFFGERAGLEFPEFARERCRSIFTWQEGGEPNEIKH
jgi:hypothetical protein